MKKILYLLSLGLGLSFGFQNQVHAQDANNGWTLSLGGGFMSYYGDLSPYHVNQTSEFYKFFKSFQYFRYYTPTPSFGLSLEKRLSRGIGLRLQVNEGSFAMSDQYRKNNGDYFLDNPNWDRALNFKTEVIDAGLGFVFRSDNGKLLRSNATIAPYLFLGAGLTYFKVKGDLFDENGNPYDYTSGLPVVRDGNYETNLRDAMTERYQHRYSNMTGYASAGLGIKFRLSRVFSLSLQTDVKYAFSDYLDDVSGKYKMTYPDPTDFYIAHPGTNDIIGSSKRGYDNGVNDFYIFNQASINISFGNSKREKYKAPIVYAPNTMMQDSIIQTEQQNQSDKVESDSAFYHERRYKNRRWHRGNRSGDHRSSHTQQYRWSNWDSSRVKSYENRDTYYVYKYEHGDSVLVDTVTVDFPYSDYKDNKNDVVLSKSDSLQRAYDSLNAAYTKAKRVDTVIQKVKVMDDSTAVALYYLYQMDSLRNVHDSLEHIYSDLNPSEAQSLQILSLNHSIDSIKNSYNNFVSQAQSQEAVAKEIQRIDSAYAVSVNNRIDSLQSVHDSLIASYRSTVEQHYRDSVNRIQNQESRQAAIQNSEGERQNLSNSVDSLNRLIDSVALADSLNKPSKRQLTRHQKEVSNYQNLVLEHQRRIDDIDSQMAKMSAPYTSPTAGNNDQDLNELRNRLRTVETEMNQMSASAPASSTMPSNGDWTRSPALAPIIVQTQSGNHVSDEQMQRMQRQLDSLQGLYTNQKVQLAQTPATDSSLVDSLTRVITTMQSQMDSLDLGIEKGKSQTLSDTVMVTTPDATLLALQKRMDSLQAEMNKNKSAQTGAKPQKVESVNKAEVAVAHFPVVSTYFAVGQTKLTPSEMDKLRPVAGLALQYPSVQIELKGYTDGTGNKQVNERVARQRCESVRTALVNKFGVPAHQIQVVGSELSESKGSDPMSRRVDLKTMNK